MSQRWQQRPEGSNWGDFGDDDQIGRMNLLTPQRRLNGLREAREGIAFALSLPLDYPGGSALSPFRKPPKLLVETRDDAPFYSYRMACVCSDFFDVCSDDAVQLHTQYSTQWDALSHWGAEFDLDGNGTEVRCYYNGYRADEDLVAPGPDGNASYARELGIENLAVAAPQGRGVLVDLHRLHGRHRVAVGYDGLMRALEAQGASIETGDFLCLYTGWADAVLEMNKRPDGEALKHTLCAVLDGSDDKLLKWVGRALVLLGAGCLAAGTSAHQLPADRPAAAAARQRGLAGHAGGHGVSGAMQATTGAIGPGDIVERLRAAFPGRVLTGDDINPKHETDLSRYPRHRPRALVLPRSTEDVSGMLALCHAAGQPVVPQGGLTGTNAGGNNVIRYGMTRDNVLGLEVVLADGRVLQSLNRMRKNTSGYDLKQLFIGSEGTLGIITKVALQLHALPTTHECAFVGLSGYPAALALLRAAQTELAGAVSSFEMLWPDFHDFMVDTVKMPAPLPGRHALYLLLDLRGSDAAGDRARLEALLGRFMEAGDVEDAAIAQSHADIQRFWQIREEVPRMHPFIPDRSIFDVSFPIAVMDEVVSSIRRDIAQRWPGAQSFFFGHIGDGNVHIIVSLPDHATHAQALDDLVFDAVRQHQGAVAAEHGIGRKRRAYLGHSRTAEEIELMRLLKRTLDPRSILNPDKVI